MTASPDYSSPCFAGNLGSIHKIPLDSLGNVILDPFPGPADKV